MIDEAARERFRRAGVWLDELLELDAAARAARLAQLSGEDADLAREVASLLAADDSADEFLAGPLEAAVTTWLGDDADEGGAGVTAGQILGPWRLVAPLGRGGMGEVWEVERDDGAYSLRAALKLLKRGLDSTALVARFRDERQILARLDHPAIARLLDGGVAEDGRPYLVLELVRGQPITEAAAASGLDLEQRLRTMIVVCAAVAAAHRALVVHRDLKPSNILLTDAGEPKLLDFGIAKLLDADGGPGLTRSEERFLTPAYAAPEQIVGEAVTTATDVYALGVVLFELLTGELPHARAHTSAAGLAAAVREETIERPSTVAARTGAPGQERARQLRGDLDAVLLRALAREPERRYPSAAALGDDLGRHLEGRPVVARPDSFGYLAGRFMRRHRLAVAAAALALLSLVGGMSAALFSAARARAEATRANLEMQRAESESKRAQSESERARRMKDFLLSVFREASPTQRLRGEPLTLAALLDAAQARIDVELADDPLLQADLWDDLAETRASSGDHAAAAELIEKALAAKRAHLGPDDPSIAESLVNRAAITNLRGVSPLDSLADLDEAIRILHAAGLGDAEPAVAPSINRVHALLLLERDTEALVEAQRAYALTRRWLGAESPDTAMQLYNSGLIAARLGRRDEARAFYQRCLIELEQAVGAEHALAIFPLRGIGELDVLAGELETAVAGYERAFAIARLRFPEDHPRRATIERELAEARARLDR